MFPIFFIWKALSMRQNCKNPKIISHQCKVSTNIKSLFRFIAAHQKIEMSVKINYMCHTVFSFHHFEENQIVTTRQQTNWFSIII